MINKFNFNMSLNEMAKDTSYRTVDDKTWASISSTCSKNRTNDAADVKPLSKLTKDDLINRYAVALIIMKKPCPTTKDEIESIGTFKNYAYKALEMGATLNDIRRVYNINSGISVDDIDDNYEDIDNDDFDDIDPDDRILNGIISDTPIDVEDWDDEKVSSFVNNSKGENNTINCPIKYSDYGNDDDFIKAFNNYVDSIKGTNIKKDNDGKIIGMTSNRYFEYGDLFTIESISTDRKTLYISAYGSDAQRIIPMPMNLFVKYNRWEKLSTRLNANVPLSYVATKLMKIFNSNGFQIKYICVNYEEEDYK